MDVASIGEETICRIVNSRILETECGSLSVYLGVLKSSSKERQNLIDDITISETWFFRDTQPFQLLSDYVVNTWSPAYFGQKLKILSVPCSTGEEPYSIAMVLSDAGFSKDNYIIDAVDINSRVLKVAKKGVYGGNSFRGKDTAFREKYFEAQAGKYRLIESTKKAVSFYHQNILSPGLMAGRGPYDVVFCRNLLIYFDLETKRRALKRISEIMSADGLLFLGHAETGRMVSELFESLRHPGAFVYKKLSGCPSPGEITKNVIPFSGRKKNTTAFSTTEIHETKTAASDLKTGSVNHSSIESIQNLADKGELNKAKEECDKFLAKTPESVEGYYLLGVINMAFGNDKDAIDSFKRAVYLDSSHYQSLVHLAMLYEAQGDVQSAMKYRARSGRKNRSQNND